MATLYLTTTIIGNEMEHKITNIAEAIKQATDNIEMDVILYKDLQELVNLGLYPQDTIHKTATEIEGKKLLVETIIKDFVQKLMEEHTKIMKLKIDKLLEGIGCPKNSGKFDVYIPSKIAPELDKTVKLKYELKYDLRVDMKFT